MKQPLILYGWPRQWLECVDARARMQCSHEKRKLAPVRTDIDQRGGGNAPHQLKMFDGRRHAV
jgi:hypothetical protein